ncbi:carbon-nitrogen hydrolase family protein [Pseudomonas sp. UBA1879]|uniref:carbon-nitrogen hydrolase family protein n=1 Tax=Pseudomonas sp. UBA1879 TaxID=1947305 RepID=UPI0025E51379|nr:carbon-nitrogen hydrolase family protein [Pseudomonas sp. UBA1879]
MHSNESLGSVVLAAAQSHSVAGDIAANMARHLAFMAQAAEKGVDVLMFPELSLTGYEPALARRLALTVQDPCLNPLRDKARELGITTIVGAPIRSTINDDVLIGALIFHSSGQITVYEKEHLHSGEEAVFGAGTGGAPIDLGHERLGLAICADFAQTIHPRKAADAGATVYAASVLISESGYAHDADLLSGHARRHRVAVMIANHAGMTGGWMSGGRSALWDEDGERVAELPDAEEGLLIAQRAGKGWIAHAQKVSL